MNDPMRSKRVFVFAIFFLFLPVVSGSHTAAVESILELNRKWTGDLDGMLQRNKIRFLVPYSKTHYFLDGPKQAGVTYEGIKLFEKWLNQKLGKENRLKVHLVIIPTPSEQLLSGLKEGRGDIAAGNLTITSGRQKIVDFSDPFASGAKEIVVSAKRERVFKSIEDLSGRLIYVRPSSSYYDSLNRLNNQSGVCT